MCGIVGSFQPGRRAHRIRTIVARMRDRMAHRGPDGAGLWRSADRQLRPRPPPAVDHRPVRRRRAADVERRRHGRAHLQRRDLQPRRASAASCEALGKYAWKTDHSDTEVLLHAYEEWGLDCVKRFYGMFAVGIYDARDPGRPVAALIRDRVGIKPMYFTRTRARRVAVRVGDPRARRASRTSRRRWTAPRSGTTSRSSSRRRR